MDIQTILDLCDASTIIWDTYRAIDNNKDWGITTYGCVTCNPLEVLHHVAGYLNPIPLKHSFLSWRKGFERSKIEYNLEAI